MYASTSLNLSQHRQHPNTLQHRQLIGLCFYVISLFVFLSALIQHCQAQNLASPTNNTATIQPLQAREGRSKPVIAVIAENRYTELTDYVIPYSVLKRANIADVFALGMQEGAVQMFPALRLRAEFSATQFDALHPQGADILIVPAVHHSDDPALLAWVKSQAAKGATIIGICDGVWVLAHAGLLDNKRAVGHWYSFETLEKQFPLTRFVKNQRYLADGKIITTTGVSASLPLSLALVEAIAGKPKAQAVAVELGITNWETKHQSEIYQLSAKHLWTASSNWLAFWRKETFIAPLTPAIDELALALTADAFSRTYRSEVLSYAKGQITSLHGLQFLPDLTQIKDEESLPALPNGIAAGQSLDWILGKINERYGKATADFVALQMEYPYQQQRK